MLLTWILSGARSFGVNLGYLRAFVTVYRREAGTGGRNQEDWERRERCDGGRIFSLPGRKHNKRSLCFIGGGEMNDARSILHCCDGELFNHSICLTFWAKQADVLCSPFPYSL